METNINEMRLCSITEPLVAVEQRLQFGNDHYSRYKPSYFISNNLFEAAIKRLGGYTYNISVGKVEGVTIFNGLTWLSVHDVDSFEAGDMWARKFEQALFDGIPISPVHIHHPDSLHTWGIEFNRDRPFWEASSTSFVKEALKLLESGSEWFYQSGSDCPDSGYQFFEYMGARPEEIVRATAVEIAEAIGTIAMF